MTHPDDTLAAVLGRLRAQPVAVLLAAATLVSAVVAGALPDGPGAAERSVVGLDVEDLFGHGRVWTLVTSVLVPGSVGELLLALGALLLGVGAVERLLGWGRTLAVWLITAVLGGIAGSALQAAGLLARGLWATPPVTTLVLHPETPVLGVLLAASAFTGPLWRRRIRLVGLSALVVLLLYSGQPEDLDHLAGALAGLGLGVLLARRRPRPSFPRSSHHEARGLVAAVVAIAAIGPVVAVLQPTGYGLLRPLGRLFRDPLPSADRVRHRCAVALPAPDCHHAARLAHLNGPGVVLLAVLPLAILLVAAVGIQRGRRSATWLAAALNGLLALLGAVYYGVHPSFGGPLPQVGLQAALAVLVPLAVGVAAVAVRPHCPVLPDRRVATAAAAAVGGGLIAASVVHLAVGLTAGHPLGLLIGTLPQRFVPPGFLRSPRLDLAPAGPIGGVLDGWAGAAVWLLLLSAAVTLVASSRGTTTARDRARLAALLRTGSAGSIAWMTTWPGTRLWFSPDGRHAVAYREGAGVALTVGEPVGDPRGAADAARRFALHCDDSGLVPAFYAVRPDFAVAVGSGGAPWSTVQVGEDTVIDPARFTMRGRHWQDVRSSVNRAERAGVRSVWTSWDALPLAQRAQIEAISEEWVADRRLPELGFTLGGLEQLADREVRLMLAVGPDGRVEAVTSWLPTWRDGEVAGLTLDFMRRRSGSLNGVVEFLIAAVIGAAQQRGLAFVSLSVAPLARADADDQDRLQRVLAGVARRLEPAYGFRSLAAFKAKFKPDHRPQVLAYPDAVALPAVTLAVARAYLQDPEQPTIRRLLGTRRAVPGRQVPGVRPVASTPS